MRVRLRLWTIFWLHSKMCLNGDIWMWGLGPTCVNPRTPEAYCDPEEVVKSRKKQECGENYCDLWEENYCDVGDVYHSKTCYSFGCAIYPYAHCYSNTGEETEKVQECGTAGCESGECKLSDLAIISAFVCPGDTSCFSQDNPKAGENLVISFVIKNEGDALTSQNVEYKIDTDSIEADIEVDTGIGLALGEIIRVHAKFPYSSAGTYNPEIILDPNNKIPESDETNNKQILLINVEA